MGDEPVETGARLGPYDVLDELGRGGMGVVYRARHTELGHEVAIKVLLDDGAEMHDRFLLEGRAAARLAAHPGIVGVHDHGVDAGRPYLVMELVRGTALDELLDEEGPLPPTQAAGIAAGVARALAHAHAHGVIHRDLKPGNVLMHTGSPRITDFGLARVRSLDDESARLTRTGVLLGTPAYAAPEQLLGQPIDARADHYALGAMLYELIAGAPPFDDPTLPALIGRALREPPPPLGRVGITVPARLERLIMRLLAKSPDDRPNDAAALADELEAIAAGPAQDGFAARALHTLARRFPRRRAAGVLLTAGVAAVVLGGLVLWDREDRDRTLTLDEMRDAARAESVAQTLSNAWFDLNRTCANALQLIEEDRFGAPHTPAELDAARNTIRTAADRYRRDPDTAGLGAAWALVPHVFDGDMAAAVDGIDALAADHPADPFPTALVAIACLAGYARQAGQLEVRLSHSRASFHLVLETPLARKYLTVAQERWAAIQSSPVWEALPDRRDLERFLAAGEDIAGGRHAAAAAGFGAVTHHPLLGRLAVRLQGTALLAAQRRLDAAAALRPLAERGWPSAVSMCATSWAFEARRSADPAERAKWFALTASVLESARSNAPGDAEILLSVANFRTALLQDALSHAPERVADELRATLAAYDAALQANPNDASAWFGRATAQLQVWQARDDPSGGPSDALERILEAFDRSVECGPDLPLPRVGRAECRRQLAAARSQEGAEGLAQAAALLRDAEADLERVFALDPNDVPATFAAGNCRITDGVRMRRAGEDPRDRFRDAVQLFDRVVELDDTHVLAYQSRARAWRLLATNERVRGGDPTGPLQAAERDATVVLRRQPDNRIARITRAEVRYGLANRLRDRAESAISAWRAALEDFAALASSAPLPDDLAKLHPAAWAALGDALASLGQDPASAWETALAGFASLPERLHDYATRSTEATLRGRQLQGMSRSDARRPAALAAVVEVQRRLVAMRPELPAAHYNLGVALAQASEYQLDPAQRSAELAAARTAVRRSTSLDAGYRPGWMLAGTLSEILGDRDAALDAYRRALALADDPKLRAHLKRLDTGR